MGSHRSIFDLLLVSPICLVDSLFVLLVPPFKLSTIGTRAFPVASPRVWNSLPAESTSAPSLSTILLYSDNHFLISPLRNMHSLGGPSGDIHLGHFKKTLIELNLFESILKSNELF